MKTEADLRTPDPTTLPGPRPVPTSYDVPETLGYRIKNRLLGPPLNTEQLVHERLGKPTALAVFASDNLSSVAYGTEQILTHLVPFVGIAAFALVMPITIVLLVVLAFLILSYRQTIKAYPSAGGAYIVTRDNFGLLPAQVAGVALLTDYVLTVSVSVAAGTAALTSVSPSLAPYAVPLSVFFILFIAFGNLRGVRESGRLFAVPTYFFIFSMLALLGIGIGKLMLGHLPVESLHHPGLVHIGHGGSGFLMGATLFVVLRAFASGGAAVTGVEAISNGVPAFRVPEWRNARTTLVIMGSTLGAMFLGLSLLAAHMHVAPYAKGTPTVISQIGKVVFGGGPGGHALYYCLQAGTTLILILAANTSFADFPRLASFHAGDNFMPRQLTKRGHRLVFSNGIIALAAASIVLVVITDAKVDRLIPLYAIGVFTSFTLSQAGMARHHVRLKEPGWRKGLFINATGAVLSGAVDVIIAITKFKPAGSILGAWVIIVLVPIMVYGLTRLNKQYEAEAVELEENAPQAAEAPILRRHVVIVFVDTLDLAAARAIQYARTLMPDELRAVHFDLDPVRTEDLAVNWRRLGLTQLPLDLLEIPDRRIARAALDVVAEVVADGETEATVLLPRRDYNRFWHRWLHDRTADTMAAVISELPHANVTIVPFHLGQNRVTPSPHHRRPRIPRRRPTAPVEAERPKPELQVEGAVPIDTVRERQRVRIAGRVHALRVQPWAGQPTLECTITDGTGRITVVFLGRRHIAGIEPGARVVIDGIVGTRSGQLIILNPDYRLLPNDAPTPTKKPARR
ncbi:MAG TPA: amino acid permease [Acidimicrobiia bacterium]|nr:amino acid permease [Acidimicrobiia bacterium]